MESYIVDAAKGTEYLVDVSINTRQGRDHINYDSSADWVLWEIKKGENIIGINYMNN